MSSSSSVRKLVITVYFSIISILASFVLGGIAFRLMGYDPIAAFLGLIKGAVGSLNAWGETFNMAGPVILTGLSYAIAARCGIINLGAEGQVYIGAICSCIVATKLTGIPSVPHVLFSLAAAFAGGMLYGLIPAIMKTQFKANELITTIMLNYLALYLSNFLVSGPMKDSTALSNMAQSAKIPEGVQLPKILAGTRLHAGIFVVIAMLVFYWFFMWHTTKGYEMRVIGRSPSVGRTAGMSISGNMWLAMAIAGGFAGLAGACELLGVQLRIMENTFDGMGFDGVAVAMLGTNTPWGIFFAGILMGAIKSGANMMQMMTKLPTATVYMLQGLIILFVAGKRLFAPEAWKRAWKKKK